MLWKEPGRRLTCRGTAAKPRAPWPVKPITALAGHLPRSRTGLTHTSLELATWAGIVSDGHDPPVASKVAASSHMLHPRPGAGNTLAAQPHGTLPLPCSNVPRECREEEQVADRAQRAGPTPEKVSDRELSDYTTRSGVSDFSKEKASV